MRIPDRAAIPLLTAVSAGFLCGLIAATLEISGGGALTLGVVVAILVAIAGAASTIAAPGDPSERPVVAALRGLCAAALFAFLYMAFLRLLRDGAPIGFLWLIIAAVFAGVLTRLRVRNPTELDRERPHSERR